MVVLFDPTARALAPLWSVRKGWAGLLEVGGEVYWVELDHKRSWNNDPSIVEDGYMNLVFNVKQNTVDVVGVSKKNVAQFTIKEVVLRPGWGVVK